MDNHKFYQKIYEIIITDIFEAIIFIIILSSLYFYFILNWEKNHILHFFNDKNKNSLQINNSIISINHPRELKNEKLQKDYQKIDKYNAKLMAKTTKVIIILIIIWLILYFLLPIVFNIKRELEWGNLLFISFTIILAMTIFEIYFIKEIVLKFIYENYFSILPSLISLNLIPNTNNLNENNNQTSF